MFSARLSKRARDAIVKCGLLDYADDDAAVRLLAVAGCGRKTLNEIARAVERSLGIKLGGYERATKEFSAKPTLTTEDAAERLGITPKMLLSVARGASVCAKQRRDGRVWSEWDVEMVRRELAGICRRRS